MIDRRRFIQLSSGALGALMLPGTPGAWARAATPDFSVGFLTDIHVDGRRGAPDGFRRALKHALDRPSPPSVLLTGGDLVYDILHKNVAAADEQYALFFESLKDVNVPVHHTIGNHDVLGVYDDSGMDPSHPQYGKTYFLQKMKIEKPYYSFDLESWHFVVLDSIGIDGRNYKGWVDAEQLEWLEDDLSASGKPTVISSHIPLFTNRDEWNGGTSEPDHPKAAIANVNEVVKIIDRHNVKMVISGHLHLNESATYHGIEFANIGAVSGKWWKGPNDGFEEGYAMLEFYKDEVSWRYMDYGWEIEEEIRSK